MEPVGFGELDRPDAGLHRVLRTRIPDQFGSVVRRIGAGFDFAYVVCSRKRGRRDLRSHSYRVNRHAADLLEVVRVVRRVDGAGNTKPRRACFGRRRLVQQFDGDERSVKCPIEVFAGQDIDADGDKRDFFAAPKLATLTPLL